MKKSLILLALAFISTTAFAQDYGNITLRDGDTIFRIDIGSEKETDSRRVSQRVARLEKAVRELQNRIYDLEDNSRPYGREVTVYTCTLPTSFDGTFVGKASTIAEARALAVNKCEKGGGFPCRDNRINACEKNSEFVRN